jgi:hypothetical protein
MGGGCQACRLRGETLGEAGCLLHIAQMVRGDRERAGFLAFFVRVAELRGGAGCLVFMVRAEKEGAGLSCIHGEICEGWAGCLAYWVIGQGGSGLAV